MTLVQSKRIVSNNEQHTNNVSVITLKLNMFTIETSKSRFFSVVMQADLLIVIGSSLKVRPVALIPSKLS